MFWEGRLPAREAVAIDDYPFAELEQAVRERFRPSALELRAAALRDRLERSLRRRCGSLRERVRPR